MTSLTATAAKPPMAATASPLKMADPTTVPIPMSDSVRNVDMTFRKNSGQDVATAMNVAAATFCKKIHIILKHMSPEEE